MARLIKVDGTEQPLGDGETPLSLEEMQAAVGEYIEEVHINHNYLGQNYRHMIVNEEGLIHNLPINGKASTISGRYIVGDVVLARAGEFV